MASLPGYVEVPRGINLRVQDLRPYLDGGLGDWRGRAFSLVSAMWLRVKGEQVRVGIYVENGQGPMTLDYHNWTWHRWLPFSRAQSGAAIARPRLGDHPAPGDSAPAEGSETHRGPPSGSPRLTIHACWKMPATGWPNCWAAIWPAPSGRRDLSCRGSSQ